MDQQFTSQSDSQHWLAGKHIVIVGAGMSGLSLALSLCKQWPSTKCQFLPSSLWPRITIFERDSQYDRIGGGREGYTLSLRNDGGHGGGVQVLDNLGLYEKALQESASVAGQGGFVMWDQDWNVIFKPSSRTSNGNEKQLKGMRIRRNVLQKVLADALMELEGHETLEVKFEWDKAVVGVEHDSTKAKLRAIFDDGGSLDCDVLIAADGANSKILGCIRPQEKLNFAQAICITGTAKFETAEEVPGSLNRDWGMVLGWNGIGIFVAPVNEKSALWSVSYRSTEVRERVKQPLAPKVAQNLITEARRLGQHAGENMNKLVNATDPSTLMIVNCMDRPTFKHNLGRDGRILFVGDANHAVSPFAGNGANMALLDGWDLAKYFLTCSSLEEAVKAYDAKVLPRTKSVLSQSRRAIDVAHATGWKASMYWLIFKVLGFIFGERQR